MPPRPQSDLVKAIKSVQILLPLVTEHTEAIEKVTDRLDQIEGLLKTLTAELKGKNAPERHHASGLAAGRQTYRAGRSWAHRDQLVRRTLLGGRRIEGADTPQPEQVGKSDRPCGVALRRIGGLGGFVTGLNNASVFLCARNIRALTCPAPATLPGPLPVR